MGEQEPSGQGHRTHNTAHRAGTPVNGGQVAKDTAHTAHPACAPVNRSQVAKDTADTTYEARAPQNKRQLATDTAHKNKLGKHTGEQAPTGRGPCTHMATWGGRGTGNNKPHPMSRTDWGNQANPQGQLQGRYPEATGPCPAGLHRGPRQMSPAAMEATGDRGAATESTRVSPAKQRGPTTQATGLRRSYRRLAGAIPPVVIVTPIGRAAPPTCRPKKGPCGPTHGHMWGHPCTWDTLDWVAAILPSQAPPGAA